MSGDSRTAQEVVLEFLVRELGLEEDTIGLEDTLWDLGVDDADEVTTAIEDRFGIQIDTAERCTMQTSVEEIIHLVEEMVPEGELEDYDEDDSDDWDEDPDDEDSDYVQVDEDYDEDF